MDNNKWEKEFPTLKSDRDAIKSSSSFVADDALWPNAGADVLYEFCEFTVEYQIKLEKYY
jgi:hypothetical protein